VSEERACGALAEKHLPANALSAMLLLSVITDPFARGPGKKVQLAMAGGADFCIKHGFKVCGVPIFPNSLQPSVYPPE